MSTLRDPGAPIARIPTRDDPAVERLELRLAKVWWFFGASVSAGLLYIPLYMSFAKVASGMRGAVAELTLFISIVGLGAGFGLAFVRIRRPQVWEGVWETRAGSGPSPAGEAELRAVSQFVLAMGGLMRKRLGFSAILWANLLTGLLFIPRPETPIGLRFLMLLAVVGISWGTFCLLSRASDRAFREFLGELR